MPLRRGAVESIEDLKEQLRTKDSVIEALTKKVKQYEIICGKLKNLNSKYRELLRQSTEDEDCTGDFEIKGGSTSNRVLRVVKVGEEAVHKKTRPRSTPKTSVSVSRREKMESQPYERPSRTRKRGIVDGTPLPNTKRRATTATFVNNTRTSRIPQNVERIVGETPPGVWTPAFAVSMVKVPDVVAKL